MSKKKKIILIFVGLFLLFAGLVGYSVYKDIRMENQLKKEIFAIDDLVKDTESFNTTEFNKRIERTVTKGDYAKVEKAVKSYLKDSVANLREITETLKDERIVNLLTVENYSNDGPDFNSTKAYITECRDRLNNELDTYYGFFTKEKIMSYLDTKNLDSYYTDLYLKELIGDYEKEFDDKTLEGSLKELITLLDNSEKIIDFLISNKDQWYIEGENIVFKTDALLTEYNNLVANL